MRVYPHANHSPSWGLLGPLLAWSMRDVLGAMFWSKCMWSKICLMCIPGLPKLNDLQKGVERKQVACECSLLSQRKKVTILITDFPDSGNVKPNLSPQFSFSDCPKPTENILPSSCWSTNLGNGENYSVTLNSLNQTQVLTRIVLRFKLCHGARTLVSLAIPEPIWCWGLVKGFSCGPNIGKRHQRVCFCLSGLCSGEEWPYLYDWCHWQNKHFSSLQTGKHFFFTFQTVVCLKPFCLFVSLFLIISCYLIVLPALILIVGLSS